MKKLAKYHHPAFFGFNGGSMTIFSTFLESPTDESVDAAGNAAEAAVKDHIGQTLMSINGQTHSLAINLDFEPEAEVVTYTLVIRKKLPK